MNFKVGDRVCAVVDFPQENDFLLMGDMGTVVVISEIFPHIGVRWDKECGGHDCKGSCETGYGWYVEGSDISVDTTEAEFEVKSCKEIKALFGI